MDTDKLIEAIENATERLGPYAQQGWEALILRQQIEAAGYLLVFVLLAFVLHNAVKTLRNKRQKATGPSDDPEMITVILWSLVFIYIACAAIALPSTVTALLVPEGAVLIDILRDSK